MTATQTPATPPPGPAHTTGRVPGHAELAAYTDDQLVAFNAEMRANIASCTDTLNDPDIPHHRRQKIRGAQTHYDRGQRVSAELLRVRQGGPLVEYGPARPVHTFHSAYHTLKAVNRLLGLCEGLYEAVGAYLSLDDDQNAVRLDDVADAYAEIVRALDTGGVDE